jgi:crotonobetainyl-CoA:carnitine CoA-transferase CaiB-like acyl-CoA transferase
VTQLDSTHRENGCGVAAPIDDAPLANVRVLDLALGDADLVTRLLADLGADVLKVEPPGGSPARQQRPTISGVSLPFALHNANKRCAILDASEEVDRRRFIDLVAEADIVVDSGMPGQAAAFGTSCAELADQFDHLVAVSVTDFGTGGPEAEWQATDSVLYALSTVLSRSGPPGGVPVLPPDGIASATAAVQAAWAALVAYYHRLRYGRGDYIDFSRYEAALQALDPPFGSQGQAAAARGTSGIRRGRPKKQDPYPIFACKDGWVRICVLAPRQWRGLRAWLGEPAAFQDPKYDSIGARFAAFADIGALIAQLFARHTMDELVTAGAAHGVPVAAVLTPPDVFSSEHFRATGALTDIALAPGTTLTAPDGCMVIDGQRVGLRWSAPHPGSHQPRWQHPRAAGSRSTMPTAGIVGRPFDGLRILDLGVIVAGGELGRLFADLGAEVIKVESEAHPDGLRQARAGQLMSESFAWTRRNQYGLGLDLRNPVGADLFGRLVAGADAVFANFKPGTLATLGFSYSALRDINPRIILAESSAYGDRGPWSARMGYGPLVRAATGVTHLWTSTHAEADSRPGFCDTVTVFPDHVVARIAAIATLAVLIRRDRAGVGGHVHVSQAETAVNQLDTVYAAEAARASGKQVEDDLSIHDVYPCAGDDEWCVMSIRDEQEWRAASRVIGRPELADDPQWSDAQSRWARREELRDMVSRWTRTRSSMTVVQLFQWVGVPAGPVNRAADVLQDPQVLQRGLYTDMHHPLVDTPLPSETGPAPYRHIPRADLRPAPMLGEHTRDICRRVLALDAEDIDRMIDDGVLFTPSVPAPTAARSNG